MTELIWLQIRVSGGLMNMAINDLVLLKVGHFLSSCVNWWKLLVYMKYAVFRD
jgi:hypothetical protein